MRTVTILIFALALASGAQAQGPDICGCEGHPDSLGAFVSSDESTYPPGWTVSSRTITGVLPDDGVVIFDSFILDNAPTGQHSVLVFQPNAANTAVTILVSGDLTVGSGDEIDLEGGPGEIGSTGNSAARAALGGAAAPGGFRGGDGGYVFITGEAAGGAGLGPLGGLPGDVSEASSAGGDHGGWLGATDLIPVSGGSGGGGGSNTNASQSCASSGGSGGGGAILIAVNGTLTLSGTIDVTGGEQFFGGACILPGGQGAGGSVRLLADTIQGGGLVDARGGRDLGFGAGGNGRIRMEAFTNTLASNDANPVATRLSAPGPVALFGSPSIAITAIAGTALPQPPQGWSGATDLLLPFPQTVTVELETRRIAASTLVDVSVKPRLGGAGSVTSVAIDPGSCDADLSCIVFADFDLAAGSYTFEAEATSVTP
jgi:hypothetical protein